MDAVAVVFFVTLKLGSQLVAGKNSLLDDVASPKDLLSACNELISPYLPAPPVDDLPIEVEIQFNINKIIDVDSVRETLTVRGFVELRWSINNVCEKKNMTKIMANSKATMEIDDNSADTLWHPKFKLATSLSDVGLQNNFYNFLKVNVAKVDKNNKHDLAFYWGISGIFENECNMDLQDFPFDRQKCDFQFVMLKSTHYTVFVKVKYAFKVVQNSQFSTSWEVAGYSHYISKVDKSEVYLLANVNSTQFSSAVFHIELRRAPEFFITNALIPSVVLAGLNVAMFLIPPDIIDRTAMNIGLVMAVSVFSTLTIQYLPQTPQRVFLTDFIQMLSMFCALCTVHSTVLFWFTATFSKFSQRKTCKWFSVARIFDIVGACGVLAFAIWGCYPGYQLITKKYN